MRNKKVLSALAVGVSLSMVLAACGSGGAASGTAASGTASGAASGNASADASGNGIGYKWDSSKDSVGVYSITESGDVSLANVKYGADYVETSASGDDTINSPSASSNIVSVDVMKDGKKVQTVSADNGGVLSLVEGKDGQAQYRDILDLVESGEKIDASDLTFYETEVTDEYSEPGKFMNMAGQTAQYTYRTAALFNDGELSKTQSITPLFDDDAIGEESGNPTVTGKLVLNGPFFNGIIGAGSTNLSLKDMDITASGDGANDFQGEGAAVLAQDDSNVTIDSSVINTQGVIRTAAAVKGNGILNIKNSVIYSQETADTNKEYDSLVVPMMKRTPFALGIEGTVRTTNVLGAGQGIYSDSLIASSGWGVLSTDSGTGYDKTGTYALNVSNLTAGIGSIEVAQEGKDYTATKEVNGTTYGFTQGGSGYVAYADSGVFDKFDNVKFYSDDYDQIMAAGNSSAYYTNSELNAGRIAVMTQQNAGGTISIKASTVNAGDTGVQIKSGAANAGYTNVIFDNAKINLGTDHVWGGTLVELVESDDAGNPGVTEFTVNDTGDQASADAEALDDSNATLSNGTYTGNIWNNIYNNTENLNVTLDNAVVNGTISSSYGYHCDEKGNRIANGTVLTACTEGDYRTSDTETGEYKKIGAQYNVANEQVNNPINLDLKNGSTWNVVLADGTNGEADACYINNLTVEEGSTIDSSTPVTIYVYGKSDIQGTVGTNVTIVTK